MAEPDGRSALKHRDFALFWIGQTVSFVGNGVYAVALPLEVLRLTGSSLDLALVIGADGLMAVIFLLLSGALVDRLSRRSVLLTANVASAVAIGLVTLLIGTGRVRLGELLALSLAFGLANSFFMPAGTAIVSDLLPPELLVAGNALSTLSYSLAQALAGPLLGGLVVVTVGTAWAFGLDGISFLIGAVCLAAMRMVATAQTQSQQSQAEALTEAEPEISEQDQGTETEAGEQTSVLHEILAGLAYCRSQPWLWWNMIAMGAANFVGFVPLVVLEPLLVKNVFHAGAVALGSIFAASGAGGVLASLYIRLRGAPGSRLAAMWVAFVCGGLAVILLGSSPSVWVASLAAGAVWFGISYGNVIWFAMMQEKVPSGLLGRVSSLDWMISLLLGPLGILVGVGAAGLIGVRTTLIVGGMVVVATGSVAFLPKVRDTDGASAAGAAAGATGAASSSPASPDAATVA